MAAPHLQQQQQQFQNQQQQQFQNQQQQQFQNQQQDTVLGTDRLTSLHAKLHQEAEKIRKWKVQTEMEMKHKDKKLAEALRTTESQRKSILDLQLESESLSSKLQDEISSREETWQRIKNTRSLITLLRQEEEQVVKKMSSCEAERTELKYLEKEHAQQFEEMASKFEKLQLEAESSCKLLSAQVEDERQQRMKLDCRLIDQTAESNQQITYLSDKISAKDMAHQEICDRLKGLQDELHVCEHSLGANEQKVSSLSQELAERVQGMEKVANDCALLQADKEQLERELSEERERADAAMRLEASVQEALNNSVALYDQYQGSMQKSIDLVKTELSEEQKRVKEVSAQLTESLSFNGSLKSSRDALMLDKTEVELCLNKLKSELTELHSEKYKNMADIVTMETEVESLKMHLHKEQQVAARLQVQVDDIGPRFSAVDTDRKQLQLDVTALKSELDALGIELESERRKSSAGVEAFEADVEHLRAQVDHERQVASELKVQVDDIGTRYAVVQDDRRLLGDYVSELKSQLETLQGQHEQATSASLDSGRLNQQLQDTIVRMEGQLADGRSEVERLQVVVRERGQELTCKDTESSSIIAQFTEANAELKLLRDGHSQTQALVTELRCQLDAAREETVSLEVSHKEAIESLEKALRTEMSSVMQQHADLEQEHSNLRKQRDDSEQVVDVKLQQYTDEHRQLEQKLKEVSAELKTKDKAVKEREKEAKSQKAKLAALERRLDERSREVGFLRQEADGAEQWKERNEKLVASLQAHLEQESAKACQLQLQLAQMEADKRLAEKEKAEIEAQCKSRLTEMSAAVEKCNGNHQQLIDLKDLEMVDLTAKLGHLSAVNEQQGQTMLERRREAEHLCREVEMLKQHAARMERRKDDEMGSLTEKLAKQTKLDVETSRQMKQDVSCPSVAFVNDDDMVTDDLQQLLELEDVQAGAVTTSTTPVAEVKGQPGVSQQRSILRNSAGSVNRRRKVAFIPPSMEAEPECRALSPPDSPDEPDVQERRDDKRCDGSRITRRVQRSPILKSRRSDSALVFTASSRHRVNVTKGHMKRLSAQLHSPLGRPHMTKSSVMVKETEYRNVPTTPKTQLRTSRFFHSSAKQQRTGNSKTAIVHTGSMWFDEDAVYGFGSDD